MLDRKKYRLPVVLLAAGIIFCLASAYANIDSAESWFARSGSILSFVSIVVQFLLSYLRKEEMNHLFIAGNGIKEKLDNIKIKSTLHQTVAYASGITGLVGTIIWGYGDLLF